VGARKRAGGDGGDAGGAGLGWGGDRAGEYKAIMRGGGGYGRKGWRCGSEGVGSRRRGRMRWCEGGGGFSVWSGESGG